MNDKILWHVSFLSSIAGECSAISDHGVAWFSPKIENYWLWLDWNDDGETKVKVNIEHPTSTESYAIIGYCHVNGLKHEED